MSLSIFDTLTIHVGVGDIAATKIENMCDKLSVSNEGRKRIVQAAARGSIDKEELGALFEYAPGTIKDPGAVYILPMPLLWDDLVGHFRLDS